MSRKRYVEVVFPPGIFGVLVFSLVFLKLSHQIGWSWLYILSPVIIGTLISLLCYVKNRAKSNEDKESEL